MAKRVEVTNPFASQGVSQQEADEALYGSVDIGRAARRDRIKHLELAQVFPDVSQPRRAIPSVVRARWSGAFAEMEALFAVWLDAAVYEATGTHAGDAAMEMVADLLNGDPQAKWHRNETRGPLEASFLSLVDLAASIHRDGLTNPITVTRHGTQYLIETGERRWLAFHLLNLHFKEGDYGRIPAREVDERSVWRQALENSARDDLNAISRARQYAILMMDLNEWRGIVPYDQCIQQYGESGDQVYYAQALKLDTPYGRAQELMAALRVNSYSAFNRYKDVLRVDNSIWVQADDENWSEREIFRAQKILEGQQVKVQRETYLTDAAFKRGKRLFSKERELEAVQIVKEIAAIRDGAVDADAGSKEQVRRLVQKVRRLLDEVEDTLAN
jgi:hypothetical protein